MLNEFQEIELKALEERIIQFIPERYRKFILGQRTFVKNVDKFEDFIIPFLNEKGLVDGKSLNDLIETKYPNLLKYISVPNDYFRMADVFDEIFNFIFGGGLL